MKKIILLIFLFITYQFVFGQPNCQVLNDSLCIKYLLGTIASIKWGMIEQIETS